MKTKRPEIPVEPLSDAAWKRIDQAVFAALDEDVRPESYAPPPMAPKPRRGLYAGIGAVAVAAAVALFVYTRPHAPAPVAVNPSHIETGDAPSRLAIGENTIEVGAASSVVATGTDATGMLVVLERGKVDCEVAPRKERPPFVVQAGTVRVRVVGTRFTVLREGTDVKVTVAHGAVEVSRGSDVVMLHDGDTWPAPVLVPPPSSTTTSVAPPTPSVTVAPPAPTVPRFDPQRAYETAAKSESSDPDGAMAAYRKIAAGGGVWAPTALFAAGRLAADRGQKAEARRLLDDYVARYPKGANAEDARGILARLR